jgi:hypothetical protein
MNSQLKSVIISFLLLGGLILLYQWQIAWLNRIGDYFGITTSHIQLWDRWYSLITDILIWLTIYLKTSIDFALLIGLLMQKYPGSKNQILIQSWTTMGNAVGTMAVLIIRFFFKEVYRLLALMIFFAALVLFELAQTSVEHIIEDSNAKHENDERTQHSNSTKVAIYIHDWLAKINHYLEPITSKVLPSMKFDSTKQLSTWWLLLASFTVPFILGMDDFAGYVPLFNVINVFWFGIWVFLGHTILTTFLFISPTKTVQVIKNPIIAILGSIAFILIALRWLYDSFGIIREHYLSHWF